MSPAAPTLLPVSMPLPMHHSSCMAMFVPARFRRCENLLPDNRICNKQQYGIFMASNLWPSRKRHGRWTISSAIKLQVLDAGSRESQVWTICSAGALQASWTWTQLIAWSLRMLQAVWTRQQQLACGLWWCHPSPIGLLTQSLSLMPNLVRSG